MEFVKTLGIEEFELWKCSEEYGYLLKMEKNDEYFKHLRTIYF